jgi:hypothetical protein
MRIYSTRIDFITNRTFSVLVRQKIFGLPEVRFGMVREKVGFVKKFDARTVAKNR